MRIGVFDSGLGGLLLLRALVSHLPTYDYVYLGDTKRVPYGNRSKKTVLEFTKQGVDALIQHDCLLIILACNTASAYALPTLRKRYRLSHPHVQFLGMIEPSVEALVERKIQRIGILATQATVDSKAFLAPLAKACPSAKIFQQKAPLLVPFIEHHAERFVLPILESYLAPLKKKRVEAILLGCTHYPRIKQLIRSSCGTSIHIFSQDEILPKMVLRFLKERPSLERTLTKKKTRQMFVTDITPFYQTLAKRWFGQTAKILFLG